MAGYFLGEIRFRDGLVIQTNGLNIDGFVATYDEQGYTLDATTIAGPGTIYTSDISKRNGEYILSGSWEGIIFDNNNESVQAPSGTQQGYVYRISPALEKLEFTRLASSGFISNIQFRKIVDGIEYISLNYSKDVSLGDQTWISQGTFEGLLLKLDVLSSERVSELEIIKPVLFPNPVNDFLYCDGCSGFLYSILDAYGRILDRQVYHQEIDVSGYVSGWYILLLEDGDGGVATLRFVKK